MSWKTIGINIGQRVFIKKISVVCFTEGFLLNRKIINTYRETLFMPSKCIFSF